MKGTQCIPNMKISIPIFSNTKMVLVTIKRLVKLLMFDRMLFVYWCWCWHVIQQWRN